MTRLTTRPRGAGTALAGAAALVTLLILVAGLPVALYWLGGDPLPHGVPAWHTITTLLLHSDNTGAVFLGAVRDVSWLAWAAFTAAVAAEAQAALRGRRAPRLRLGGLQNAAGWLVALTMIALAGQPATALAFAPPVQAATAPATRTPAPSEVAPSDAAHPDAAPQDAAQPASATDTAAMANPSPQVMSMGFYQMVTVQPGDCLWTIAQRHLGNGDLYTEIAQLNLGHNMGGGEVFSNPSVIWPGWVLQVPASPSAGQPAPGQPAQPSAPATSAAGQHGSHDSSDPAFSQPHPSAGATQPAGDAAGVPAGMPTAPVQQATPAPDPATGVSAEPAPRPAAAHTGGAAPAAQTTPAGQSEQFPELGVFAAGVLVGGASVALARMRRRQRQGRRPGRRIPLPASAPVLAVEQRLRAAAQRLHPGEPDAADPGLEQAYADAVPADPGFLEQAYDDAVPADPGFLEQAYPDAPPAEAGLAQAYSNGVSAEPAQLDYDDLDTGSEFIGYPRDELAGSDMPEYPAYEPPEPLVQPATALRAALSQLGASLVADGRPVPDIAAVAVRRSGLELLLAAPPAQPPPAPFTAAGRDDPVTWRLALPKHAPRPPLPPAQTGDLLPGLVTAGATADGGYLLIDLEHLGVTTVEGPADLADLVLATAAAELTTSQLAGWYDLILAGFPELGVVDGRATSCGSLHEALDLLAAKAVTLRRRLGGADVRRQRIEEPGDEDWALTLLVSRTPPTASQMAMLLDLANAPGGIAALVASGAEPPDGHPAPASLRLRDDPAVPGGVSGHVSPVDLDVRPQPLSRDDYEALASLFATAADQGDVAADEPPYDGSSWPPDPGLAGLQEPPEELPDDDAPADLAGDEEDEEDDGPGLRIGVMGTFTINGAPAALQPAQGQLILALALNGSDGLSNAQLCYLLGADPDHPKPSDSLRQLIVRTRRQLGRAAGGREWIEHLGAGQYALHPKARFDWADFEDLSERGIADRDPDCLHEALALIRGRPFTGCYHWWLDVAFTETVRAQIVDTAELLAELELTAGDSSASARAARTGLAADPAAEQLWRAVMRAEHASGNLAGVREAWSRCLDAITDIAADGEPHPDTTTLYQQLTGATQAPSGWAGQAAGLHFR